MLSSPSTYVKQFGSLNLAYQTLFADTHDRTRDHVLQRLEALALHVEPYEDFLVVDRKLTVLVQPSVPMPYGFGAYWYFRPDHREVIDITLGVPLSDANDADIIGYLALARLLVKDRWLRVFSTSTSKLDMYGHNGLDIIHQLVT